MLRLSWHYLSVLPQSHLWASWRLGFVLLMAGAQGARDCRLAGLLLRFGSQPVDLVPPFSPNWFSYTATLGFNVDSFSVDTFAMEGCKPDNAPNQAISVAFGDAKQLTVYAKDLESDAKQGYEVRVQRLSGSESQLQFFRIQGGILSPSFSPTVVRYTADLSIEQETIQVRYMLTDLDEKIYAAAGAQFQKNSSDDGVTPLSRRLTAQSGEVQYIERMRAFPVDVGYTRSISMMVQSADDMQARRSTYVIDVTRQSCTLSKPLFDPVSGACVNNCPTQFYANPGQSRCSLCNTNCLVCVSLVQCQLCNPDTSLSSFIIQGDGSCLEMSSKLEGKYRWWVLSACIFMAMLMGYCLYFCCDCLCSLCCGGSKSLPSQVSDVDSEEEYLRQRPGTL